MSSDRGVHDRNENLVLTLTAAVVLGALAWSTTTQGALPEPARAAEAVVAADPEGGGPAEDAGAGEAPDEGFLGPTDADPVPWTEVDDEEAYPGAGPYPDSYAGDADFTDIDPIEPYPGTQEDEALPEFVHEE